MHELALTNSIVDTVLEEMKLRRLSRVEVIGLKVGVLSGALPDAIEFCFDVISRDTRLADTRLVIESVPLRAMCRACNLESAIEKYLFACSECGSRDVHVTSGEELNIAYLQVADIDIQEPVARECRGPAAPDVGRSP